MPVRLRPLAAGWTVAFLTAGFGGAAMTTGSGWLVVLAAIGIGLLVVGSAGPLLRVARVSPRTELPADAVAGSIVGCRIGASRPAGGFLISIERLVGPVAVFAPTEGTVPARPQRRGVLDHLTAEVTVEAPLGLVRARRRVTVALERPLVVAPRAVPVRLPPDLERGGRGEAGRLRVGRGGDRAAGVREYRPGDPPRLIHWAASAGPRGLLVKELEEPSRPALTVVAALTGTEEEQEEAASRAAGLVAAALREGLPVRLHTREAGGERSGPVGSTLEAGRRLARAVAGPVAGPAEAGGRVVRVGAP